MKRSTIPALLLTVGGLLSALFGAEQKIGFVAGSSQEAATAAAAAPTDKPAPAVQLPIGVKADSLDGWTGSPGQAKGGTTGFSFKLARIQGKKCALMQFRFPAKYRDAGTAFIKNIPPVDDFRALRVELYNPDFPEMYVCYLDRNDRVFVYRYAVRPSDRWQTVEFNFDNAIPRFPVFSWGGKDGVTKWAGGLHRIDIGFPQLNANGKSDKPRTVAIGAVTVLAK